MAINVDTDKLPEESKASTPETKYIPAGNQLARLVSYVELGKHFQKFKGQFATYDSGKLKGKNKPPCMHIALTFEFPQCEYTGDYPLTLTTSAMLKNGEFMNALTVPPSLEEGKMSLANALRTRFLKYLKALQAATGLNYTSIADFAKDQVGLMINVTNRNGKGDNSDKVYANMKPEGIQAPKFTHPGTGKEEIFEVPEALGEYCTTFEWDAPTAEAWKALKPWDRKIIKDATNFMGSPIHVLLESDPELDQLDKTKDESSDEPEQPADSKDEVTPPGPDEDLPV